MRIYVVLLLLLFPTLAFAAPHEPEDKYLLHCYVTPSVDPEEPYPGRQFIVTSNKLVLPAGKAVYAPGQLVYISGRVLDENCVPVSDAIVDIWQSDSEGHYVKPSMAKRLSPDPYFTGSGRSVTDNLGRFNFVTLFPGPTKDRGPHIHFFVIHKNFPTLVTEMFFENDHRNMDDEKFKHLTPQEQALVIAKVWQRSATRPERGLEAQWNITLKGKDKYRHF